jgi:putative endonuclease
MIRRGQPRPRIRRRHRRPRRRTQARHRRRLKTPRQCRQRVAIRPRCRRPKLRRPASLRLASPESSRLTARANPGANKGPQHADAAGLLYMSHVAAAHRLSHDSRVEAEPKTWWVYLLACRGGRTYAGIAIDVKARFLLHRTGKGAKFTRANPPRKILGAQAFPNRSEALKAEYALKQLNRSEKLAWARRWSTAATESV